LIKEVFLYSDLLHGLEKDVFPLIGKYPISEIKAPVLLDVLRQIENAALWTWRSGKATF